MFRVTSKYKLHTTRQLVGLLGLNNKTELNQLLTNKSDHFREKDIRPINWFEMPKKPRKGLVPSGKMWHIHKRIAQTIGRDLLSQLPKNMMGGRQGYTTRMMATLHCGKEAIVRLDIKGCFDAITPDMVYKMFRKCLNENCSDNNVQILTNLVTIQNKLPQGAHASPAICNGILLPVFNSAEEYCLKHGLVLSSWIDDFIISGNTAEVYKAIPVIKRLMEQHAFSINEQKIDIGKRGGKFEVTGLAMGKRPSVSIKKREALRGQYVSNLKGDSDIKSTRLKGKLESVRPFNPGYAKRLDKLQILVEKSQENRGTI